MAYGDLPADKQLYAQWSAFCDRLKEAGKLVFKDANPATDLHRADGFRYLTQNLGKAYEFALETKNTKYPQFMRFNGPSFHLGSDNADCTYIQAWIDGSSVYRISGTKGSARFWNLAIQGPRSVSAYGKSAKRPLHDPFGDTPEANLFGEDLKTNRDGTFELYIGGPKRGQNWLPTTSGSRKIFLRQYFDSWEELTGDFLIERVDMTTPRPMPDSREVLEAMQWAAGYVYDVMDYWPDWPRENGVGADIDHPNKLNLERELSGSNALDKRRGRAVGQLWWDVDADEALIVEFADPRTFWMITCETPFCASMDFLYRSVSFTPSRTPVDADGKIRLVLTRDDPGYANWIDCQGLEAGALTFRNIRVDNLPEVETRLVPASEIPKHMHASSRRITAQQRTAQLKERFDAIRRRYPL